MLGLLDRWYIGCGFAQGGGWLPFHYFHRMSCGVFRLWIEAALGGYWFINLNVYFCHSFCGDCSAHGSLHGWCYTRHFPRYFVTSVWVYSVCVAWQQWVYVFDWLLWCVSTVFAIEENNSNPELHTAKIISMLVGVFFISLGIYWIVVYCWSRRADVHRHDFSPLALLWWLLSLYFTGLFFSLLTETIDKRIYKGDYLDKNCFGNDRINNVSCYNWIVPSALSSMVLLELVYVVIFCCVTAKRCLDRWREDYVQLP